MGFGTSTTIRRTSRPTVVDSDRRRWHERASSLYEELRGPARALVRRGYGATFSEDEIDDLYSSAWLGTLRALERRATDMPDEEVRSYVLTAVANHAGKEIRRRRRKPIAPLEAAGEVAETTVGPEDAVARRETREVTRDLLASLPPRRRAVMLLRYGWGLDPAEICGMVTGLSARAYRKEVTKGVDELVARIQMVDEGRWCKDREPVLKAYAAGLADGEERLQAESHLTHCRSCSDYVAKLMGHLHDLGTAVLVPSAFELSDGPSRVFDRLKEVAQSGRDSVEGLVSRSDPSEAVSVGLGVRSTGAAGAGIMAKVSALGAGGKAALACLGGSAAATACVAAGLTPLSINGAAGDERPEPRDRGAISRAIEPIDHQPSPSPPVASEPQAGQGDGGNVESHSRALASEPSQSPPPPALEPTTPPTTQEFGVESAVAPASSGGSGGSGGNPGSGGGAISEEFGP